MATLTEATPHQRMTRARLFAGIEQQEMARLLGKNRNTISAWERGLNDPPLTALAHWAHITGQSIDWLVWGDGGVPADFEEWCARRDSNPQPSDLYPDLDAELAFWSIVERVHA